MYDVEEVRRWLKKTGAPAVADDDIAISHYRGFYNLNIEGARHEFGELTVGSDRICLQRFSRRSNRAGTAFLLHGYLDHGALLYKAVVGFFERGYDVVLYDQPGHGLSTGDRANVDSFAHYVDCLDACVSFFEDAKEPRVVMGHSMGGAVSMTYLLKEPGVFEKAILQAPLYRPRSWRLLRSLHFIGHRFVEHHPRRFVGNTHDPEYRHFIREVDPLSPRQIPMQWLGSMFDWTREFKNLPKGDTSVLVLQGTDDGTVDWRGNIKVIRKMFRDVRIHLIDEARHNILADHDEISEKAWDVIDPFLSEHRAAAAD